jgi:hypothetical protein
MESRTQRLARLARLLGQRQTSFEAQRTTLEAQARRIEDQRRMLLQTLDASIAAHGLYVDLLAGRMKRLDADTHSIERQTAALADQVREDARRIRLVERMQAHAVRHETRERDKRELADLLDAGRARAASFP